MFKALKQWWNRDKILEQQINEKLQSMQEFIESERAARKAAEEALAASESQVNMFRAKDEADRAKREGKEPWVEIKSADYSDVRGIHIELDWNEAFIQYLKDNGITGRDEETAVQKWLAFLYQDLINRLEQKVVDKSDKPHVNDFE